jgi:hypothetical protein
MALIAAAGALRQAQVRDSRGKVAPEKHSNPWRKFARVLLCKL